MKYFIHKETKQIFSEREIAKNPAKVHLVPYYPPKYLVHVDNGRKQLWTPLLAKTNKYIPFEEEEVKSQDVKKEPASKPAGKRRAKMPSFVEEHVK